jgi:Domain of unknown function (DUF4331)
VSHHLDTPLASQTGQLYLDDLFVFPGEDSTVLVMDVNSTITGAHAEPAFHPEGRYEVKVHLDGAEFEDLTYRVSFGDADADGRQPLQLHAVTGPEARDDSAAGESVLEGRTGEPATGPGIRLWAAGGPIADLIAATVAATGTSGDPAGYGRTVARELFPDVLSYEVGTPAIYGFATRNGRTLADNAPEAMLSLVTNTAVPSGLTPAVSQQLRNARFPYVVPA